MVSVLPVWPDRPPEGQAPEGSGVVIAEGGYLATAFHVVGKASEINVRLADGSLRKAELVGRDPPTDLAVLKIEEPLPPLSWAEPPALAQPVCAVGNQFGLGLSVTCGVVSAVARSGVGFNPIEDFIQTDATVNPGSSGGALVDAEGRLVGLLSAIFTKQSDADIGVNFAVSAALLRRVVEDLIATGRVQRVRSGLRVTDLPRARRFKASGALVMRIREDSPAARAGLQVDDIVTHLGERSIRKPSDLTAAVQLQRPGDRVLVKLLRGGQPFSLELRFDP